MFPLRPFVNINILWMFYKAYFLPKVRIFYQYMGAGVKITFALTPSATEQSCKTILKATFGSNGQINL